MEEIIKNVEGNLKEDARSDVSEEGEIPPKEEENLIESSGEDKEILRVSYGCHKILKSTSLNCSKIRSDG